jgi:hypothetical protein
MRSLVWRKLRARSKWAVEVFKTDFGERLPTDVVYYEALTRQDAQLLHFSLITRRCTSFT